jgi:chemotaxis response regulator CheB
MTTSNSDAFDTVPIVCIGLSAGAIKPLEKLFRDLNPRTGMAFVVIHHLREQHPTLLPSILSRCTQMDVELIRPGMPIEPDHVYVIPSGSEVIISDATLGLRPRTPRRGWSNVVSLFLDSLTHSSHPGVAVILSGMDEDGAVAMKAFKQHGGITIAQSPGTAVNPEMPDAAIKSGAVDYVLPPESIASRLEKIARDLKERRIVLHRA